MTQFVKREAAEELFNLSLDLCRELIEGISDMIDQTNDKSQLAYMQHILSDAGYGIEIITKTADNLQFYEVKSHA